MKLGSVKKRIDTANRETIYDYDTANRLIKTTDADLKQTQFEYNPRSQMTKVTDALSQVYDFSYDALGRQLSQTRSGNLMSYEYDSVGNRTKRTDYLNQITNYTFDNLNRLTNITYPDATENVVLTYDVVSRLTKATKNAQDITFAYDTRNRMTSTTDVHSKIVAMTYDAASNRTALKLSGVNFSTYVYDVADRLTKITNSADAKAVSYLYDNANRMTKETLPNGIASNYSYDGMSRLTQLKDVKGATTLFDRQFAYNDVSQIAQIAELTQTRNFNYDTLDRLTSVAGSTSESYAFDGVGNRTSSHLSPTYNYQPNNRLTNTASTSYVYNSNGNMVSKTDVSGTTQYIWDYENRLKQVLLPNGQNVVYKYDALGRRIERNLNNSASWQKFTYDGQDVMLDQNSDGTSVTYLNGLGIDNKLRQTVNGQAQYFLNDHLGSTNGLADASGNIISSTNYDSFGNASNANFPTRYQFTGRELDNFIGLHYYRARWYDANLGRFISEDPIGFRGGDVNLYGYVWNSPEAFVDPEGLSVLIKLGKFISGKLVNTGKQLTMKQAQNARRLGGNIIVEGNGSQRVARQIETGAFKRDSTAGKKLRHDPHQEGFSPHYQTNKKLGHTFYGGVALIFAPNITDLSESSCTTNSQFASAVLWDGISLIDPIGLTDTIEAGTGLDGGRGGLRGLADLAVDNTLWLAPFQSLKELY